MGLHESLLFYFVIGCAVAVAVWSQPDFNRSLTGWFQLLAATAFWPVFLPILLTPARNSSCEKMPDDSAVNSLQRNRIQSVKQELTEALAFIDGWTKGTLHRERGHFQKLFAAWDRKAERIAHLDLILSRQPAWEEEHSSTDSPEPKEPADSVHRFERARQRNLQQLAAVRQRCELELTLSLAKVRELISAIYVAEMTDSPESRADELIRQIADSLDGLSEVADWQEPESIPGGTFVN